MTDPRPSIRRPRFGRRVLVAFLLLLPLVAGLFGSPLAGPQVARGDDISNALAQQRALQAKIASQKAAAQALSADQAKLTAQIGATRASLTNVTANLQTVQAQIGTLADQVAQVKARYDQLVAQLADLEQQLAVIEVQERVRQAQLEERQAMLAARLRAAYRTDETSMLETVLSAQSFAAVVSDVGYYLDIGNQDRQLAQQIGQDQLTLSALHQTVSTTRDQTDQLSQQAAAQKKQLDAQMSALQAARNQLKRLQDQIAAQLAAQRAAYAKLAANKAQAEAQAAAAQAALEAVNRRIAQLAAEAAARGNIPSAYNGTMIWPMGGEITQNFGCTGFWAEPPANPAWGYGTCAHFHTGIDLVAPCGTPVHAAADGVVVWAGFMPPPDGAFDVEIAHSSNLLSLYGHFEPSNAVWYGESVHQGDVVGYEGTTGNSTGCHLHWAVYLNGIPVNPRLFL